MPENNKFILHETSFPNKDDWSQSSRIKSTDIKKIEDPSGGRVLKAGTSVPNPFARMYTFDTAFKMVNEMYKQDKHIGKNIHYTLVSHCLDLLDILFNYTTFKEINEELKIKKWTKKKNINELIKSDYEGHHLLAQALTLFLNTNEHFKDINDFYLFFYDQQLIGGTSPFSLVFSSPDITAIELKSQQGHRYFEKIVPLHQRDEKFQLFLYHFFAAYNSGKSKLKDKCRNFYNYLENNKKLINTSLKRKLNTLKEIDYNQHSLFRDYDRLSDNDIMVNVGRFSFVQKKGKGELNQSDLSTSDFLILSSKIIEGNKTPLVLKDQYDDTNMIYVTGYWNPETRIPNAESLPPLRKRKLPGLPYNYPFLTEGDFLEDYIIQLPYPINEKYFQIPSYTTKKDNKVFEYLLPIKKEYFNYFTLQDLNQYLDIVIRESSSSSGHYVDVTLKIPLKTGNIIDFNKNYYANDISETNKKYGKILSDCQIGLGFFPFFKTGLSNYDNYYKIMLTDELLDTDDVELKFYDNNSIEIKNDIKKINRRNKKTGIPFPVSTTYYELNKSFQFLQVLIPDANTEKIASGIIIPKWKKVNNLTIKYNFAIDFGTTNTHVAYNTDRQTDPSPLSIGNEDLQVIMLNSPSIDLEQGDVKTVALKYEKASFGSKGILRFRMQNTEFVPSIIGNEFGAMYQFPIRTVSTESKHFETQRTEVLGNINIGFTYEKEEIRGDARAITNLKWSTEFGDNYKRRVKAFFKELLLLIKHKIILNEGNPAQSRIAWFVPMSMSEHVRGEFKTDWEEAFKAVFGGQGKILPPIPEAVAPYYYLSKRNKIVKGANVMNIDIGGGTTDILLFQKQVPTFSTSFTFGANAIWGEGFNAIDNPNARSDYSTLNGYFRAFQQHIKKQDLEQYKNTYSTQRNTGLVNLFYTIMKIDDGEKVEAFKSSADFISFLFSFDEAVQPEQKFQNFVKQDKYLKIIPLFHYAAIIYHIGQLINFAHSSGQTIQIPRYLVFSGKGGLYIKLLGVQKTINKFTTYLIKKVCPKLEIPNNFEVILVDKPKEVTANGGVLASKTEDLENVKNIVFPGVEDSMYLKLQNPMSFKLKYRNINNKVTQSIINNINILIDIILDEDQLDLKNLFGIGIDIEFVKEELKRHIEDGLTIGVSRFTEDKQKIKQNLSETLFFYPFNYALYKLSIAIYDKYYNV